MFRCSNYYVMAKLVKHLNFLLQISNWVPMGNYFECFSILEKVIIEIYKLISKKKKCYVMIKPFSTYI
jgi:hypothetical protein